MARLAQFQLLALQGRATNSKQTREIKRMCSMVFSHRATNVLMYGFLLLALAWLGVLVSGDEDEDEDVVPDLSGLIVINSGPALSLESESRDQEPNGQWHRFEVRNATSRHLQCTLDSASCGCISFRRDGRAVEVNQPWELRPGESSRVEVRSSVRTTGETVRSFDLVAVDTKHATAAVRRRVEAVSRVLKDVTSSPSAVTLTVDDRLAAAASTELFIETITRGSLAHPDFPAVRFSPPFDTSLSAHVINQVAVESLPGGFIRRRYRVVVALHGDIPEEPMAQPELYVDVEPPATEARHDNATTLRVPVVVQDVRELRSVRHVDFGDIVVGGTATRRFAVIAHRSGQPIALQLRAIATGSGATIEATHEQTQSGRHISVIASAAAISCGLHTGSITVESITNEHNPLTIPWRARVVSSVTGDGRSVVGSVHVP
jgi:hypothetical protein